MKRITFTEENRTKNRQRTKTQTRRIHVKPQYKAGEILIHCEPTQVLTICDADFLNLGASVLYPDSGITREVCISQGSLAKLYARKDWNRTAIARFMLSDFAREYLRITEVRQERLQEISEEDAIAEGITALTKDGSTVKYGITDSDELPGNDDHGWHWQDWKTSAKEAFASLWDSINTKPGRRWEDNPTVFAYSYEYLDYLPTV